MQVEFKYLYSCILRTIDDEFSRELSFIVRYRAIRKGIDEIVALPDRLANLFIKLSWQNGGRFNAKKRLRHFAQLTAQELAAMEKIVRANLPKT